MKETPDDIWADVRRRWNQDDLPVLLGKVGDAVMEQLERSMAARAAPLPAVLRPRQAASKG